MSLAPTSRKSSTVKIVPMQPSENGAGSNVKDPHIFERPKLREVPKTPPNEQTKLQSREVKVPVALPPRRDSKDLPQKVHIESKKREEGIPKVELRPVNKEKKIPIQQDEDSVIEKVLKAYKYCKKLS